MVEIVEMVEMVEMIEMVENPPKWLNWFNWHVCTTFQRLAFWGSTAGNDVVATLLISFFSALRFLLRSPLLPFLIEEVLGSKNLFSESC